MKLGVDPIYAMKNGKPVVFGFAVVSDFVNGKGVFLTTRRISVHEKASQATVVVERNEQRTA